MSEECATYDGVRPPISTCCPRCEQLTDLQISALLSTDIQVGRVCYTRLGQITPSALGNALTRREYEILVALLRQYPGVAAFTELGGPLADPIGVRDYPSIRMLVGLLNAKLRHYGVSAVAVTRRGYHLVQVG